MSLRPLFLARQEYRRRRLRDAARLLPVAGALLLILPLAWQGQPGAHGTAGDGLWVFAVWFLMVAGAAMLAPALGAQGREETAVRAGPGARPGVAEGGAGGTRGADAPRPADTRAAGDRAGPDAV